MAFDSETIEKALEDFSVIYAVGDCHVPGEDRTVLRAFYSGDPNAARAELEAALPGLEIELVATQSPLRALAAAAIPMPTSEPGGSIGTTPTFGATLGCFVSLGAADRDDPVFLTAAHPFYTAAVSSPILLDCGNMIPCTIGELPYKVSLQVDQAGTLWNDADCALGAVTFGSIGAQPPLPGDRFSGSFVDPASSLGLPVFKYGAKTGRQTGRVCAYPAVLRISFPGIVIGGNQQQGLFRNQVLVEDSGFAEPGDSGSLVAVEGTGDAVGVLFAGTRTAMGGSKLDLFAVSPIPQVRIQLNRPNLSIRTA